MLERDGEQAGNVLRSRLGKREKRELFEQAIALLEADGLVAEQTDEYKGAKRVRYRIGSGLTTEVRSQNRSSEGVTHQVRPDHPDNVTDLDTRRSNDQEVPKPPCPVWFGNNIAARQARGDTTADSFAVYTEGRLAGYKMGALRSAANAHPDITTIDRRGGKATWDITGATRDRYQSADQWAIEYLKALPAGSTVDKDAYQRAARAAGHTWDAARHAATASGLIRSERGEGTRTVWIVRGSDDEEGAS